VQDLGNFGEVEALADGFTDGSQLLEVHGRRLLCGFLILSGALPEANNDLRLSV
jgi:hypothetical protein